MGGIIAWLAKKAIFARLGSFLKSIPWQIWLALIAVAALTLGYCHAERTGEKKGAAKVEAKVEKAHAATIAQAKADTATMQTTTDRIAARAVRIDDATTAYAQTKIGELHAAIDSAPSGPAAAPVDTARVSASLDDLIAHANGAADAADAQPGTDPH
ncbi:hypothetical protein BH10PSE14_BH10PSE14_06970 [soil metagenome]